MLRHSMLVVVLTGLVIPTTTRAAEMVAATSDATLKELPSSSLTELRIWQGVTDEGMAEIARFTQLEELDLSPSRITDAGLQHLSELTQLRRLHLPRGYRVTDRGLSFLTGMHQLEELDLAHVRVSDEGLALLVHFPRLTALRLGSSVIEVADEFTANGLAHLTQLNHLRSLDLCTRRITAEGLQHIGQLTSLTELKLLAPLPQDGLQLLAGLSELRTLSLSQNRQVLQLSPLQHLTKLERLDLSKTLLRDEDLAALNRLTELQDLDLSGTGISDAALVHLKPLVHLQKLNLCQNQITGTGFIHLRELTQLKSLNIFRTRAGQTRFGVAALENRIPGLKVVRNSLHH